MLEQVAEESCVAGRSSAVPLCKRITSQKELMDLPRQFSILDAARAGIDKEGDKGESKGIRWRYEIYI
jgi:hypothetical protein